MTATYPDYYEKSPREWANLAAQELSEYLRLVEKDLTEAADEQRTKLVTMIPQLIQAIDDMHTRVDMWHSCLTTVGEAIGDMVAGAEQDLADSGNRDWRELYAGLARGVGMVAASYCGTKGGSFDRWYLGVDEFEDDRDITREWRVGGLPDADFSGIAESDVETAKARAMEALERRGYRVLRWEVDEPDIPWTHRTPGTPDTYVAHVEPIGRARQALGEKEETGG